MIFLFILSLLLSLVLFLYVLSPLFSPASAQLIFKTTEKNFEEHLAFLIERRNQLLEELIEDTNPLLTEENPHFRELLLLCREIEEKGFSWKPVRNPSKILLLLILLPLSLGIGKKEIQAEESVSIPPPVVLREGGYWVPSVNQYLFIPAQGKLHVYYVGMFRNNFHAKGTILALPLPKNIENLKILDIEDALFLPHPESVLMQYALSEDINQVRAEFTLDAPLGRASWEAKGSFPGIGIFLLPEYLHLEEKNVAFERSSAHHPAHSFAQQLIFVGSAESPFPCFSVTGIVPSRTPLSLLALVVFSLVALLSAFRIFALIKKSTK